LYHLNVELATERNRVKRLEVELESFREWWEGLYTKSSL
jgi:hypothetical protein